MWDLIVSVPDHCLSFYFKTSDRPPMQILIFISVASLQAIWDWNALVDSLISSAEGAEDIVAKFSSLVRT